MMQTGAGTLESSLSRMPVIAILRGMPSDLDTTFDWLVQAGVEAIEVTTNTPHWSDVVSVAQQHPFAHVGVGTVLSPAHVQQAHESGATFTVSPGLDARVVEACRSAGLEHLPGVATASEVQSALALGLSAVKFFPAGAMGVDYLRALRAPFDDVRFVATGGVSVDNAEQWLGAGAFAVGIGSALIPDKKDERDEVAARLRQLKKV